MFEPGSVCLTSPPVYTWWTSKPIIFAIVGKSASGKDYLAKMLVKEIPLIHPIVSWTTRPPREGEKEGEDYHFVSEQEFLKARRAGEFIEWARFNGWYYGTPHSAVSTSAVYIGVFNLTGLASLMRHQDMYQVIPIYMDTPLPVRLKRSIKREHKLTPEMIRRMLADHRDFSGGKYDMIKKLGRAVSLNFNYHFVEQHPDMVISTVWTYIHLLEDCEKFGKSE